MPSLAVAAFMLVLSALVYLIARLRGTWVSDAAQPGDTPTPSLETLLDAIRDEVPWLGAVAPHPAAEERRVDGE